MKDGRCHNGRPRLLGEEDEKALRLALLEGPPDGGLWSGRKVAEWIRERKGVECHDHLGWSTLKRLGFSVQRPGPRQPKGDQQAQAAFKKGGL